MQSACFLLCNMFALLFFFTTPQARLSDPLKRAREERQELALLQTERCGGAYLWGQERAGGLFTGGGGVKK